MAAAVPFAMKAAPWIAQGVGALVGRKVSGPSKEQKGAMASTQQAGADVAAAGRPLTQTGLQTAAPAAQYYRDVLSSRRAATESLAPETTTALEYYRGAEGKTKRTMQGGARDVALAELDRQKVGQLAGMLPSARREAAAGAGQLGTALTGQGLNAAATNAYIQSGLFNQATTIREQQGAGGKAWGGFLHDIFAQFPWGKGKPLLPNIAPKVGMAGTQPSNFPNPAVTSNNPYYR